MARDLTCGVLVAVLSCACVRVSVAGDRVNVRGMGMARTSVSASRGLDAVGINPANLSFPDGDVMTLTILPAGAYLSSDFFTYDLYSRYFQNRRVLTALPAADKESILNSFENPTGTLSADIAVRLFGITLRINPHSTIAFTVDYGLTGAATVPRAYARLLLFGNVPGSTFDIEGLSIKGYWARSYALSYGTRLPTPNFLHWLAGGVAWKMIQGYGYYEIERFKASVSTRTDSLLNAALSWKARRTNTNTFSHPMQNLFQNSAGYGLGVDIGISGGLNEYVSFGISVTDVGWVKWTEDVEEFIFDSTIVNKNPDVLKRVQSLADSSLGGKKSNTPLSTSLPAVLRFGVSAQVSKLATWDEFPGELMIAAEYLQGLTDDSPMGEEPRFSFGVEYKPVDWLPIRAGISYAGRISRIALGFGFDFRLFNLDLATEDVLWLFTTRTFSTGSVGLAMRFRVPE